MSAILRLSALALRTAFGPAAGAPAEFLQRHVRDHNTAPLQALKMANHHAWKAIGVALGGQGWFGAIRDKFADGDQKLFREQIRAFVESNSFEDADPDFLKRCAAELRVARDSKILPGDRMPSRDQLARETEGLLIDDPRKLLEHEMRSITGLAKDLRDDGYPNLARLAAMRPNGGLPLVVLAVRYFFRKEVENDPKLSATMTLQNLEDLGEAQKAGFEGMHRVLVEQGDLLAGMMDELLGVATKTLEVATETRDLASKTLDSVEQGRDELRELKAEFAALVGLLAQNGRPAPAAPAIAAEAAPSDATLESLRLFARDARLSASPEAARAAERLEQSIDRAEADRRMTTANLNPIFKGGLGAKPPASSQPAVLFPFLKKPKPD